MRTLHNQLVNVSIIFLLSSYIAVYAETDCNPVQGRLVSLEGSVEVGYGNNVWTAGKLNAPLCENNSVRVGRDSRAAISLIGDVVLRLDQNTTIRLIDLTEKPNERSIIDLLIGAIQSFSRSPRKLAVNTPFLNGMIEGTEFLTRVGPNKTEITVFEGKVIAINDHGSLTLTRGKTAVAKMGQAPQANGHSTTRP